MHGHPQVGETCVRERLVARTYTHLDGQGQHHVDVLGHRRRRRLRHLPDRPTDCVRVRVRVRACVCVCTFARARACFVYVKNAHVRTRACVCARASVLFEKIQPLLAGARVTNADTGARE